MHPLHVPILLVLLLIPNSSWHDWQTANAPHFQQILQSGMVAVMNDRTAETDQITPEGCLRTFLAGARMESSPDTSALDYAVKANNLVDALRTAGISVEALGDPASKLISPSGIEQTNRGQVVIEVVSDGIERSDLEIEAWRAHVDAAGGALVIASMNPSLQEYERFDRLTPIVIWRPGDEAGMLYSPSTRHTGLITNTDVAPTIAALAGVRLAGPIYGAAVSSVPTHDWIERSRLLDQLSESAQAQARAQTIVPYFAIVAAVLIMIATLLWLRNQYRWSGAIVVLVTSTVVFLITFSMQDPAPTFFSLLALAAAWLFELTSRWSYSRAMPAALIAGLILLDALLNKASVTASSLLGYSFVEGARYYGLGNEAMGIVIGAATVVTGVFAAKRNGILIGSVLWVALAVALGLPNVGAKVGGLLVAMIALAGYLCANIAAPTKSRGLVRGLIIGAPLAAALIALVIFSHIGATHLSGTMSQAQQFGGSVIWSVAYRKASMDLHLMAHSAWMLVLLASLSGTWLLSRRMIVRSRVLQSVLITGYTATAACFFLNDAGVVAAALCAIFPWSYVTTSSIRSGLRRPLSKFESEVDNISIA